MPLILVGYSHGGSLVFQVSQAINARALEGVSLIHSGYIDAIRSDVEPPLLPVIAESRRPIASNSHTNFYQSKGLGLRGTVTASAVEGDYQLDLDEEADSDSHSSILSEELVLSGMLSRVAASVS